LLTLNPTDHWRKKRASPGSPFFFTRYATIYSGQSPPFIQDANSAWQAARKTEKKLKRMAVRRMARLYG
jgi:hypothetical protein